MSKDKGQLLVKVNATESIRVPKPEKKEEPLELVRQRLQERLTRMKAQAEAPVADSELLEVAAEAHGFLAQRTRELETLQAQRKTMDPVLFQIAEKQVEEDVQKTRADLEVILRPNPMLAVRIAEIQKRNQTCDRLEEMIPEEVTPETLSEAIEIRNQLLEEVVRGGLFAKTTAQKAFGKETLSVRGEIFGPASASPGVLRLFDAFVAFYQAIGQAIKQFKEEKKEETREYVRTEDELREEAEEVVFLNELLLKPGLERVTLVPIYEYNRFLGKAAVTRKAGGKLVIFAATSHEAAAKIFKMSWRDKESGEVKERWIPERYLDIPVEGDEPDFSQISFVLLRESFRREFERNRKFDQERKEVEEILQNLKNTITREQLLDGEKGFCPIRLRGWKVGGDKTVNLTFVLEGDGEGKIRLARATERTRQTAIFLDDLVEWKGLALARQDRRLETAIAMGEEWENRQRVQQILQDPEIKNLREKENLEALLAGKAGEYFFFFIWFNKRNGRLDEKPVNAVLEMKQGKISVKEPIGYFSERLIGNYCEVPLGEIRGPLQIILRNFAERQLDKVPEFLWYRAAGEAPADPVA